METKGEEDLDVPLKMERLKTWVEDINKAQKEIHFDYVFVEEEEFKKNNQRTFSDLVKGFTTYKQSTSQ